ncbi:hypothetical protein EJ06DRAFT_148731 [Trichodelitschia bisporula]|uniref:Uncharacterized protein n=1 Tax=Trichodelitschia bisporula TaxID=703511 RepID=A0A6G1HN29_9PEZI|nr:hypothetical protein EJ06DRAFT_148731 [Trichodelitschia bisporula]
MRKRGQGVSDPLPQPLPEGVQLRSQRGRDFGLYADILKSANLLGVHNLHDWIREERYRQLVSYHIPLPLKLRSQPAHQYPSYQPPSVSREASLNNMTPLGAKFLPFSGLDVD